MKTAAKTLEDVRARGPFSRLQIRVSIARNIATLLLHNGDGLACGLKFDPKSFECSLEDLRRDALEFCSKHDLLVRSTVEVTTVDLDMKH